MSGPIRFGEMVEHLNTERRDAPVGGSARREVPASRPLTDHDHRQHDMLDRRAQASIRHWRDTISLTWPQIRAIGERIVAAARVEEASR